MPQTIEWEIDTPKSRLILSPPRGQTVLLLFNDNLICETLSEMGFDVVVGGEHDAITRSPALVISNGPCPVLREHFRGALLMIGDDSDQEEINALESGADDYVRKPVNHHLLLARIRKILRRHPSEETIGPLRIDRSKRQATVHGETVPLTELELDILLVLAENRGTVVSREQLYLATRGDEYDGLERGVDVHISRIRRKLRSRGFDASRIRAIRGVGYLLTD